MKENGIAPLTWEGKRSAAAVPDAEVVDKPIRRRFAPSYKLRIVEEADRCTEPGEVGRLLRREGMGCRVSEARSFAEGFDEDPGLGYFDRFEQAFSVARGTGKSRSDAEDFAYSQL